MLTLIVFLLILSFLVLIHELGHFAAAKKLGVRVEEFGLGLPPRVIGKKIGETTYSFNILPFGGFVKLTGEDEISSQEESQEEGQEESQTKNQAENRSESSVYVKDSKSFVSKTPLQRAVILVAGVFMNLMLAVFLYYVLFISTGFRTQNLPLMFGYEFKFGQQNVISTLITGFSEDSPLNELDLEPGEAVVRIDEVPVSSVDDVREQLLGKAGTTVTVDLVDLKTLNDTVRTFEVVPIADEEGNGLLGVYLGSSVSLSYDSPSDRALVGFLHAFNMLDYTRHVLGSLIGVSVDSRSIQPVSQGVAGPVGIYSVVGGILDYGGDQAFLSLIDFIALMSLSLAFLNIMPFPALDGGRLLFVLFEMVSGRKMKPAIEVAIHKWGMIFLLALIILVTVKDIGRFF